MFSKLDPSYNLQSFFFFFFVCSRSQWPSSELSRNLHFLNHVQAVCFPQNILGSSQLTNFGSIFHFYTIDMSLCLKSHCSELRANIKFILIASLVFLGWFKCYTNRNKNLSVRNFSSIQINITLFQYFLEGSTLTF